jgi:hypothetical protein
MVYRADLRRMTIRLALWPLLAIGPFVLPGSGVGPRIFGVLAGLMWLAWLPLTLRFRVVIQDHEVRVRRWSKERVLRSGEWRVKGVLNLSMFGRNTVIQLRSTTGAKVDLPLASMSKNDQAEVLRGVTQALASSAHR